MEQIVTICAGWLLHVSIKGSAHPELKRCLKKNGHLHAKVGVFQIKFVQRTNIFHWRSESYSHGHGGNSDMLCLDLVTLTINC